MWQHVLLAVRDGDEALLVERMSAHDAAPVRFAAPTPASTDLQQEEGGVVGTVS